MSAGSLGDQNPALGSLVESVIAGDLRRENAYQVGPTCLACKLSLHGCDIAFRGRHALQGTTPSNDYSASGTSSCVSVSFPLAPLQAVGPYLTGKQVLADILMPISYSRFFNEVWEQRPLFISRPSLRQWYSNWLSEDTVFDLLSKGGKDGLRYGYNLDVTTYTGTVSPVFTM